MTAAPLKPLAVAARLCAVMHEDGNAVVAEATRKTAPYLLLMVGLKVPVNRSVLRYLGLRRIGPSQFVDDERLATIRPRYLENGRHVA